MARQSCRHARRRAPSSTPEGDGKRLHVVLHIKEAAVLGPVDNLVEGVLLASVGAREGHELGIEEGALLEGSCGETITGWAGERVRQYRSRFEARNSVQVFGIKGFGGRSALERGSRWYAPRRPACWRMLSVAARTVTLALWAWTRALDVGTRWVSERGAHGAGTATTHAHGREGSEGSHSSDAVEGHVKRL